MKKIGLIWRLVIALALGILGGYILGNLGGQSPDSPFTIPIRAMATFNGLFGGFLSFVVPLLILSFITVGISDLGKGAGKLLLTTVAFAYVSTVLFATGAFAVDSIVLPLVLEKGSLSGLENPEHFLLHGYIKIAMPPIMDVMSALVLAFIVGIGLTMFDKTNSLTMGFKTFQGIIEKLLDKVVIPLLPFHIGGIFANMTYNGKSFEIMKTLAIVFVLIVILHWCALVIQYAIAGSMAGKNPFTLLKNMLPAYGTAIGTQSSAATIPVTLKAAKANGVKDDIADFVVPLCATIHLSGSAITLTTCAFALSYILDFNISFPHMMGFIFMLGVTMVAAPGVPGGAVMAALGLLQTNLGFNETMLSLMIALYLAQDSFGTATNVTGDGAIAIAVNKIAGNELNLKKAEV